MLKKLLCSIENKTEYFLFLCLFSICNASETWAYSGKDVEVVYRNGLRTALGVRQSTCNGITYIESNKCPLKCRILPNQLKFWLSAEDHLHPESALSVKEYIHLHPESALYRVIGQTKQLNVPYYKHYDMLEEQYTPPRNCRNVLEAEYKVSGGINLLTLFKI